MLLLLPDTASCVTKLDRCLQLYKHGYGVCTIISKDDDERLAPGVHTPGKR